jgi:glycosyltransferase involved in cell wall biosynthesis
MPGDRPLVSLVMPCRNGGRFLDDAVGSLFAQDYPNLEVVVCDDASDDGSTEKLQALFASYSGGHKTTLLRNEARQGIETYNRLMEASSGDFVVIAHADDVSYPSRVRVLTDTWLERGVSLVASNARAVDEEGREIGPFRLETEPPDFSLERIAETGWQSALLGATLAWERAVFDRFGPISSKSTAISSDWILPFRAALLNGIAYVQEPLLDWRYHPESRSRQMLSRHKDERAGKEAAHANALIQTVYLIETLESFTAGVPQDERPRLERARAILDRRLFRLARDWGQVRNALMHDRLRPRWVPPEEA